MLTLTPRVRATTSAVSANSSGMRMVVVLRVMPSCYRSPAPAPISDPGTTDGDALGRRGATWPKVGHQHTNKVRPISAPAIGTAAHSIDHVGARRRLMATRRWSTRKLTTMSRSTSHNHLGTPTSTAPLAKATASKIAARATPRNVA